MNRLGNTRCILLTFFASIVLSCEQEEVKAIDQSFDFKRIFESFWHGMNSNYVYWDIDSTQWNEVYDQYFGIFSQLDLTNENDVRQSAKHFRMMTKNIIDGHCQISFAHPLLYDSLIDPLYSRKKGRGLLNGPFSYFQIDTTYLDQGYEVGYDFANGLNGSPLVAVCGTINNEIIYFSCNFFSLVKSYYSTSGKDIKETIDFFFDYIKEDHQAYKGIIIDIRNNSGGDLADLNFLMGRLIDQPLHIGYSQYKNGPGRSDFTPWIKAYVNPQPQSKAWQLPVIALADNYSASLAELYTIAIQSLPNGIFIGETTWGATGPVIPYEIYNSGSFEVEGFLKVQLSSGRFRSLNQEIYEGIGVIPDIYIPNSPIAYLEGRDLQLEKAIEILK